MTSNSEIKLISGNVEADPDQSRSYTGHQFAQLHNWPCHQEPVFNMKFAAFNTRRVIGRAKCEDSFISIIDAPF